MSSPRTARRAPAGRSGGPVAMRVYGYLVRSLPIYSGLTRLSFNPLTNRAFARCGSPVVAKLLDGTEIDVDPNEHDGRVLYLFGVGDRKVYEVAKSLLRPGDRFLDIGANHGSIGLLVGRRLQPRGEVHLFEPQAGLAAKIARAVDAAPRANVTLHQVALFDSAGRRTLSRPTDHTGMGTLVADAAAPGWVEEQVDVHDIATYVPPLVDGERFGVKLDVEGAEPVVMPWLVAQPNLTFVIFEASQNRERLVELVRENGLTLFGLRRTVLRCRIRLAPSLEEVERFHDLVAVRLKPGTEPPTEVHPAELAHALAGAPTGDAR